MSTRSEQLKLLPISERLKLVEDLAADLAASPLPESLRAEMDARLAAYLADPSTSLSLEEVQRRMKAGV